MKCYKCGYNRNKDYQFCQRCLTNLHNASTFNVPKDKRFGWLLSENKWHEDIASRHRAPDGSIVRIPQGKEIPWIKK